MDIDSLHLIGLSGKMGSGKDTAAALLKAMLEMKIMSNPFVRWDRKSFATRLNELVGGLTDFPAETFNTEDGKNILLPVFQGKTGGQLLQEIDGMMCEKYGADIWIDLLLQSFDDETDHWIITDVCCESEAKRIKDLGGILIRIEGDPARLRARKTKAQSTRVSETELDDYKHFDLVIDNSKPDSAHLRTALYEGLGFAAWLMTKSDS